MHDPAAAHRARRSLIHRTAETEETAIQIQEAQIQETRLGIHVTQQHN
jgi:hypothetical protein